MPAAFQFNVEVNGVAVVMFGAAMEWILPPTFFITPLGLLTRGLVVGLGDQWRYDDTSTDPSWATAENQVDPGWAVDDL